MGGTEADPCARLSRTITREDVINAERSLFRVRHELVAKRSDLGARADGSPGGGAAVSNPVDHAKMCATLIATAKTQNYNPTWVGRVFGGAFASGNGQSSRSRAGRNEGLIVDGRPTQRRAPSAGKWRASRRSRGRLRGRSKP